MGKYALCGLILVSSRMSQSDHRSLLCLWRKLTCGSFCGHESDQSGFISDMHLVIRLQSLRHCCFVTMWLLYFAYHM